MADILTERTSLASALDSGMAPTGKAAMHGGELQLLGDLHGRGENGSCNNAGLLNTPPSAAALADPVDLPGQPDGDSAAEDNFSDGGPLLGEEDESEEGDDVDGLGGGGSGKLDAADREWFKRQEREEREEIELELKAHHQMELVRHQEELRLREKELQQTQDHLLKPKSAGGGLSPGNNGLHGGGGGGVGIGLGGGGLGANGGSRPGSGLGKDFLNGGGLGGGLGGHFFGRSMSEELRAHVQQAAQLAALGQFPMPPHLVPHFGPNGMHPLRAAAMLPAHGPFVPAARPPVVAGGVVAGGGDTSSASGDKFPNRTPSQTPRPPSSLRSSPEPGSEGRSHHWTFEEQFKQLYEIDNTEERKEFLDDLFAFMQKRGTPVNRIPIMAKQTLDLYELFRLVVSKGGLVEVINKKLWREITKGLNLPSSITSAAFTLRTQYMKYLYPYECEKLKLSNPNELQSAIDGNRREGRRSSYGYDLSPGPTLVPPSHPLNGTLMNGKLGRGSPGGDQWTNGLCHSDFWGRPQGIDTWRAASPVLDLSNKSAVSAAAAWAAAHSLGSRVPPHAGFQAALEQQAHHMDDDDSQPSPPHVPTPRGGTTASAAATAAERDALAMEAATRAMEETTRKMEAARLPLMGALGVGVGVASGDGTGSPPRKRPVTEDDRERMLVHAAATMPSAHFKITSRNDGRSDVDGSLVVTMDVNGVMYQGILYATGIPTRRL